MTEGVRAARVTYREVLRVREFRAIFLSQGLSLLGDQIARIAVALLVYDRTDSAFAASATFACGYLTWLLGGPVLSTLADRYPRLTIMVVCDLGRAALVGLLVIPDLPLPAVFALLIAAGLLAPPFDSARSATLPDVLPGEQYVVGNALMNVVVQGGQVLGFLAGGALVATVGVGRALLLDAATFLVSGGLLLLWVKSRPSAHLRDQPRGLLGDTADGIRVVAQSPRLRGLLAIALVGMATVIAPEGLAVAVADDLGHGAVAAGWLTASIPLGFLIGSAFVLRVAAEERERLMVPMAAWSAGLLLLTPLVEHIVAVTLLWVAAGAGSALQLVAGASFMQAAPANFRARAYGVAGTTLMGVQGVSLLVSGGAGEVLGAGNGVALLALLALACLPLVTRLRSDAETVAQGKTDISRGTQG
jgi:MFS family permease